MLRAYSHVTVELNFARTSGCNSTSCFEFWTKQIHLLLQCNSTFPSCKLHHPFSFHANFNFSLHHFTPSPRAKFHTQHCSSYCLNDAPSPHVKTSSFMQKCEGKKERFKGQAKTSSSLVDSRPPPLWMSTRPANQNSPSQRHLSRLKWLSKPWYPPPHCGARIRLAALKVFGAVVAFVLLKRAW